jgi:hypothetical protein
MKVLHPSRAHETVKGIGSSRVFLFNHAWHRIEHGFRPNINQLAMLIGLVMVFAIMAVGFGYVVFAKTSAYPGLFWDLGFLASLSAFLASFISLIWRHAERQLQSHADSDDDPGERR